MKLGLGIFKKKPTKCFSPVSWMSLQTHMFTYMLHIQKLQFVDHRKSWSVWESKWLHIAWQLFVQPPL